MLTLNTLNTGIENPAFHVKQLFYKIPICIYVN